MSCCGGSESTPPRKSYLKVKKSTTYLSDKNSEAKIVFLGDAGVGKSSISQRFVNNKFSEHYEVTIGGAYLQQQLRLRGGKSLRLHLWDTGGEERFKAMTPFYYRDADAAVLVYDVTNIKSFWSLEYWVRELSEKAKREKLVIVLAGNKSDVSEKQVTTEQAQSFADAHSLMFFETSAKTGDGINELFKQLGEEVSKNILAPTSTMKERTSN